MKYLGITIFDLGQKILDLGSGREELFSKEVANNGVKVISLNPALAYPAVRESVKQTTTSGLNWQRKSVAGIAQQLPFNDSSFDSVVSVAAIPFYLEQDELILSVVFKEIQRVLKENGKAFLAPIPQKDKEHTETILRKNNIPYKLELIPRSNSEAYKEPNPPDMFNLVIFKLPKE